MPRRTIWQSVHITLQHSLCLYLFYSFSSSTFISSDNTVSHHISGLIPLCQSQWYMVKTIHQISRAQTSIKIPLLLRRFRVATCIHVVSQIRCYVILRQRRRDYQPRMKHPSCCASLPTFASWSLGIKITKGQVKCISKSGIHIVCCMTAASWWSDWHDISLYIGDIACQTLFQSTQALLQRVQEAVNL